LQGVVASVNAHAGLVGRNFAGYFLAQMSHRLRARKTPRRVTENGHRHMTESNVKSSNIVLYAYAIHPDAARVNCFLDYKELEFNIIYVNPLSQREIRFTRQHRVPVLKIGETWKTDITAIGLWLEEQFPEKPLLAGSQAERELILQLNHWVDASLMPICYRQLRKRESFFGWLRNGWRLGAVLQRTRPLPFIVRLIMPALLEVWPLVGRPDASIAFTEPLQAMEERACKELLEHLGKGPFLGELTTPSLADLAAYPPFIMPYLLSLRRNSAFFRYPRVLGWMSRVQKNLPPNPLPVPKECLTRPLPYST
jgi:glutathione S-transferase